MALSIRHSPYSIPSPRFNYNPSLNAAAISGPSTYNLQSSNMFGLQSASMFNSMSPLATTGAALHGSVSSSMGLLPASMCSGTASGSAAVDNSSGMSALSLTHTSGDSPGRCCSESPTSDCPTADDPSATGITYSSSCSMGYGPYSSPVSPPSSPLTNSILDDSHSPPPLPLSASTLSYPSAPPATMLPTPMYSSQKYSSSSLPSSMPMPLWSPYPSLPSVGPLPATASLPKLSYDSPRYKLTPERAIPLIKWFEEHKEHPYPTRHEKIVLCQSTQLTFTQVSTWFANARRRMKKANSEDDDSSSSVGSSGSESEGSPKPVTSDSTLSSS